MPARSGIEVLRVIGTSTRINIVDDEDHGYCKDLERPGIQVA